MKNNLKENKGITLVALIITIIVLLILAVVTISAVNEGKLFAHANNAATGYRESAELENTKISDYLDKLNDFDGQQTENSKISIGLTRDNTLVNTPNLISTTCSETLTATLAAGMNPNLLVWSVDNENVSITGSGTSVTISALKDGTSVITANYNNGEFVQRINVTVQNKWRQRGLTTEYVEFGATYTGNVGGYSQSMSFNEDGSISAASGGLTSEQVDYIIQKYGDTNENFWITVTTDSLILEFPNKPTSNQTYTFTADGIYTTYQDMNGTLVKE